MVDNTCYQVLARKYRPTTFDDLKGQPILVQTLRNAIFSYRIPHAILLIGHRGIGKTTTARIIAQTLNCQNLDTSNAHKINPCGHCDSCQTIQHGNQLDVVEIDAASHSGIENIKMIVDSSAYKPHSLTYRVFIIDEIHMLSKHAFNALLKTLEEPPPHLKFIFATTEVSRLPDTIVSRCVRFDLNPFSMSDLKQLINDICHQEKVSIDNDACALLAYAAQGSARDALSILDQAINSLGHHIHLQALRPMLGYAQQNMVMTLLQALMQHNTPAVIKHYNTMIDKGATALNVIKELHHIIYVMVLIKNGHHQIDSGYIDPDQLKQIITIAQSITQPTLMRLWQSLHKGIDDLKFSYALSEAGLMLLLRLCYLSELPEAAQLVNWAMQTQTTLFNPQPMSAPLAQTDSSLPNPQVIEPLNKLVSTDDPRCTSPVPQSPVVEISLPTITTIEDLKDLCTQHKEPLLRCQIEKDIIIHKIDPDNLTIHLSLLNMAPKKLITTLKKFLQDTTGQKWHFSLEKDHDDKTTDYEQQRTKQAAIRQQVTDHPDIKHILTQFPDAEIIKIDPIPTTEIRKNS